MAGDISVLQHHGFSQLYSQVFYWRALLLTTLSEPTSEGNWATWQRMVSMTIGPRPFSG